jgi:hypothetical protein
MKDDSGLYKMWWYMVLYGMGVETRCKQIDSIRKQQLS